MPRQVLIGLLSVEGAVAIEQADQLVEICNGYLTYLQCKFLRLSLLRHLGECRQLGRCPRDGFAVGPTHKRPFSVALPLPRTGPSFIFSLTA
jgi:hypothetical protein